MQMPDVNVLIYAHRTDAHSEHGAYAAWLVGLATASEPFALSGDVLSGFIRIVTNPRVFKRASTLEESLAFVDALRSRPSARLLSPGPRHFDLFIELCLRAGATGKLVPDAYLAALAIEHGCELLTTDSDFSRFSGLRYRHPLARTQG